MGLQVSELAPRLHQLAEIPETSDHSESEDAEQGIKAIATIAKRLLQATAGSVPPALTTLVLDLHDQALLAVHRFPSVQDAVLKLCIEYWLAKAPNANAISVQMVCYLLHIFLVRTLPSLPGHLRAYCGFP
jgi:hypothetical protein